MNDTTTYLISTYCSIGAFAFFVYILKQFLLIIKVLVTYSITEWKKDPDAKIEKRP